MLALFSYHDTTITLDGQRVTIQIKRLTFDEAEAFRRKLRWFINTRQLEAPAHADGTPVPPDEAEAFDQQRDAELSAFVTQAVGDYVRVKPGQIALDGTEITTGTSLVRVFGGAPSVVLALLLAIGAKNDVSAQEKKVWWSLSGLTDSLPEPETAAGGPTLDATATSAGLLPSVDHATAPESHEMSPSGSTETSN